MKRILLLTDFSKAAGNAVAYAQSFWSHQECEFYVMHVVRSSAYTTESLLTANLNDSVYKALLSDKKKALKVLVEHLQENNINPEHSFHAHLDHDNFIDAIEQLIATQTIDAVVIGSNGASNVNERLFGSHALQLMRNLQHNILVVPGLGQFKKENRLMLLVHENDQLSQIRLNRVADLASMLNSEILVLNVNPVTSANKDILNAYEDNRLRYYEVTGVPFEHAASTFAQTNEVSLIVMVGKMAHFSERLMGNQGKTNLSKMYKTPLFLIRD